MNASKINTTIFILTSTLLTNNWNNVTYSQTQYKIPITVSNTCGDSSIVEIGWDRYATHCIDSSLGELELPPLPPAEIFDIRLIDNRPSYCLGEGLKLDLKKWMTGEIMADTFVVAIQSGSCRIPIKLTWPNISNSNVSSLLIQDDFGGLIINVNMLTESTLVIPNPVFTTLFIYHTVIYSINIGDDLPTSFILRQNYPNPFNPSTTISYDIPENGHVKLSVYDIMGREVAILVNEYKRVGRYKVEWNATEFPSGVYFYRIKVRNNLLSGKMSLIK